MRSFSQIAAKGGLMRGVERVFAAKRRWSEYRCIDFG